MVTKQKTQVDAQAESLLGTLIAMRTTTEDVTANDDAIDYIGQFLGDRGMDVRFHRINDRNALIAFSKENSDQRTRVILSGHIDVVEAEGDSFTLTTDGDRLYGRGVYDMKFAIAGYMRLVDELAPLIHEYDFGVMVTSDEELGASGGINGTEGLMQLGYRADVCILPDSAAPGWNIERLAKGFWRFMIISQGKTAHSSRPWDGDSAAYKLIAALHELQDYFTVQRPNTDTINIGVINGGKSFNQIPSYMTAAVEIRLMSEQSHIRLRTIVEEICRKYDVQYRDIATSPPLITDLRGAHVRSFCECVERITGHQPEGVISLGATDAPFLQDVGIPCVVSCPQGGGHHGPDEWLDRTQFAQFITILKDYLANNAIRDAVSSPPSPRHLNHADSDVANSW